MIDPRRLAPLVCPALLAAAPAPAQVGPGDPAPPISIEAITNAPAGTDASWDSLGEGVVVVEFWGTWCSPCVAAIPHMNELQEALGDRARFLSVTHEPPALIDEFRKARPMRSWIGHDTDRSMVRAYGVRSWPTMFVVRNGVIVARAHPMAMTEERLRTYIEDGAMDAPPGRTERDRANEIGANGRPPLANEGYLAGIDPYSVLVDEAPEFQIIIRRAGEKKMLAQSNDGQTLMSVTLRDLIAAMWGVRPHRVEGPPELDEERRDVILRIPRDRHEELMPLARSVVSATLGYSIERLSQEAPVWALRVAPEGLKLHPSERAAGSGFGLGGTHLRYTSAGSGMDELANALSIVLERPVRDETGLDGLYFVDINIPIEDDADCSRALREHTGLTLERADGAATVDVVTVRRADN